MEKAVKRKVPKLVRTQADKSILLLQREHITMGDTEILDLIEKFAPDYPDIAKVDEIWFVNTSIMESEGWVISRVYIAAQPRSCASTMAFLSIGAMTLSASMRA